MSAPPPDPAVVRAVRAGLTSTPKTLPPWLFYDRRGSELFEQITELPEYYLTRAEREIFERHGDALMAAALPDGGTLVEFGAGSATKTAVLLAAAAGARGLIYVPIDVSPSALAAARANLQEAAPEVTVEPWPLDTISALPRVRALPSPKALLFIGSSIGNYDHGAAREMLAGFRTTLGVGETLVLGTDLAKDPARLLPAYDDAAGVTAAFNRNVLVRLRRELGADVDPERFRHEARWNEAASRVEMHLVSVGAQRVRLGALDLAIEFADGESIHTESSHKYTRARIDALLGAAGFARTQSFADAAGDFEVHVATSA
ncbi:MAG: L-histidine N(alpha)-methyltransferase [Kofleriaceae bacterium]